MNTNRVLKGILFALTRYKLLGIRVPRAKFHCKWTYTLHVGLLSGIVFHTGLSRISWLILLTDVKSDVGIFLFLFFFGFAYFY